jgi:hypothetical protein
VHDVALVPERRLVDQGLLEGVVLAAEVVDGAGLPQLAWRSCSASSRSAFAKAGALGFGVDLAGLGGGGTCSPRSKVRPSSAAIFDTVEGLRPIARAMSLRPRPSAWRRRTCSRSSSLIG